ncbi:hypothetical protein J6590_076688 [Homalodisca vitripennis]|nr:hypothetical protein J6590_076688 [Homalodisca vitripennis]
MTTALTCLKATTKLVRLHQAINEVEWNSLPPICNVHCNLDIDFERGDNLRVMVLQQLTSTPHHVKVHSTLMTGRPGCTCEGVQEPPFQVPKCVLLSRGLLRQRKNQ